MLDIKAWERRTIIKNFLLLFSYHRAPGRLSGTWLNRMAGLLDDAEMPPELMGLTPDPA